jgi:cytosine/adenosine deaminase-related metal-dependent hydrolase
MQVVRAAWMVPVEGPPRRDGWVAVEAGRIVGIGDAATAMPPATPTRDLGEVVLLPGLINAHCHLELSSLGGRVAARDGFVGWVRALVALRPQESLESVRAAARAAIAAVKASGTVAVGDVSNALAHLDLLAESRLRAVVFHELLAWDPERAEAAIAEARARVAALNPSLGERGVEVRLAAHAPHSTSPQLLRSLGMAGGPASIHLAESREERRFLEAGGGEWAAFLAERRLGDVAFTPPGRSPVAHLEALGVLHADLVAAHCVQLDGADIERLARAGTHVALCPRSNRFLGVGLAPVPRLLESGVRLCLGTDSLASAPDLDLGAEMAALSAAFPTLPAAAVVRMATRGGAEALGLLDLGALAPGRTAAFAQAAAPAGLADPLAFLVSGEARFREVPV